MLKRFWQNLGLSYNDIKNLPQNTVDTLHEIICIEEQYIERNIRRSTQKQHGKKNY